MNCRKQLTSGPKVVNAHWMWFEDEMLLELSQRGYNATTILAHVTDIAKFYMESQNMNEVTFGDWRLFTKFINQAVVAFDEAGVDAYDQAMLNADSAICLSCYPANSGEDLPPGEVTLKLTFRPKDVIADPMFESATMANPDAEPENY